MKLNFCVLLLFVFSLFSCSSQRTYKSEIHNAAAKGDLLAIDQMLQDGALLESVDYTYKAATPLFAAVIDDQLLAVKLLLKRGANPNGRDDQRFMRTPLMVASYYGRNDIAFALLEAGATLDLTDVNHANALLLAALQGHDELVAHYIDAGANPNHVDRNGYSILMLAGRKRRLSTVKLLVEKGADVCFVHPVHRQRAVDLMGFEYGIWEFFRLVKGPVRNYLESLSLACTR